MPDFAFTVWFKAESKQDADEQTKLALCSFQDFSQSNVEEVEDGED